MLSITFKEKLLENKLNIYFVSQDDKDYNITKETIVPANPCCNGYSVAKAFTVTAIGMLYDKGLLKPESLLTDILSNHIPNNIDPKWHRVTIHHLMKHKVGFGCGMLDIDCEDASLYPTTDYLQLVLKTNLKYEPGTTYQYTDAAYYLLSRVIYELTQTDLSDVLRPILMDLMKFKEYSWSVCPKGYSIGATGLYLRTEDMVKLGILYLNKGMWKETRVLSEEWIDMVIANEYEFSSLGNGWYGKVGMRGQLLMFNMEKGKAIACHSYESTIPYKILMGDE